MSQKQLLYTYAYTLATCGSQLMTSSVFRSSQSSLVHRPRKDGGIGRLGGIIQIRNLGSECTQQQPPLPTPLPCSLLPSTYNTQAKYFQRVPPFNLSNRNNKTLALRYRYNMLGEIFTPTLGSAFHYVHGGFNRVVFSDYSTTRMCGNFSGRSGTLNAKRGTSKKRVKIGIRSTEAKITQNSLVHFIYHKYKKWWQYQHYR